MSRPDTHTPTSGTSALHAVPVQSPAPVSPPRRGTRAYLLLGALALLILGGIGAYSFLMRGQESTDDAVVEADVVSVTSRVSGVIAHLNVHENQAVRIDCDSNRRLQLVVDQADVRTQPVENLNSVVSAVADKNIPVIVHRDLGRILELPRSPTESTEF